MQSRFPFLVTPFFPSPFCSYFFNSPDIFVTCLFVLLQGQSKLCTQKTNAHFIQCTVVEDEETEEVERANVAPEVVGDISQIPAKDEEAKGPISTESEDKEATAVPASAKSNENSQPARSKVTFDDISGDGYDKSYDGPLISLDQLSLPTEDLTEIVFCKHFNVSVSGSVWSSDAASRMYVECADAILEQGVARCLASYNSQALESRNLRSMNLVTFREALHHAARLSRALVGSR